jgi:integrase
VKAGRKAQATVDFYTSKGGTLIRLFEGDPDAGTYAPLRLKLLRAWHVDDFIAKRRAEGAGENTISKELVTLRAALKLAKRAGLWKGDIGEIIPVAFAPEYEPRKRFLSPAELQRLLPELLPDRAAHVAFIVATSASWGESERALRDDVAAKLAEVYLRGTKRKTRKRTVPIETEAQRSLLKYALANGQGEGGRLFAPWGNVRKDLAAACRRVAIAIRSQAIGQTDLRLRKAIKAGTIPEAGIEALFPRCSPNDLRRTFAHWMRAAVVPLELIAPLMGHATTRMVEKVYGKMEPAELAARLRGALGGSIAGASQPKDFVALRAPLAEAGGAESLGKEAGFWCPGTESNRPHEDFQSPRTLWPKPRKRKENRGQFKPGTSPVHQSGGRRRS